MSDDKLLFDKREFETVGELRSYLEQLPGNVPIKVYSDGSMLTGVATEIENSALILQ